MLVPMRLFKTALVYALGVSVVSGAAHAATAVATTTSNLRRAPSMSGAVVGVVPRGHLLTVACRGGWCRTSYRGQGGYVASHLLHPVTRSAPLAGQGTRFFASCQAMRRAGAAPVRLGHMGYRTGLDRNHNGWACEPGER